MKVLITGAKGQLGRQLVEQFSDEDVVAVDADAMDIIDAAATQKVVADAHPDWIIHAAAWTNVDEAARQPEAAMKVNGEGTRNVARAAAQASSKLVYISSNEVFAGDKTEPYIESDIPTPINAYGQSKLAGEQAVQTEMAGNQWVVVRTSWLYGPTSSRNFPNKIIQVADERGSLKVVDDEISTPTYVPDLAKAIANVLHSDVRGIIHLVNEGSCSRLEWAKLILEECGRGSVPVEPIKLADYPRASTVPSHCVLANTIAKKAGIVLPDWQTSVAKYARLYLSGK